MAEASERSAPDTARSDTAPLDADGQRLDYRGAITELESILAELDGNDVDVDRLADRVRRAAELVRYCRARLDVVRDDVADVVGDLDRSNVDDA